MLRLAQSVLTVLGVTALTTVGGFFGLAILLDLVQTGSDPVGRGFGQYIGGMICGAPLGALLGFAISLAYVRAQQGSETWSPFVWMGVALGSAAAIARCFFWWLDGRLDWWGIPAGVLIVGTAGGIVGRVVQAATEAGSRPPRRR